MNERRRAPRFRTLTAGSIIFDRQLVPMLCAVRDVSKGGARLFLGRPGRVPDEFDLSVPRDGLIYHCRVTWRGSDRLGVAFHASGN
jgi:hypothetical protein